MSSDIVGSNLDHQDHQLDVVIKIVSASFHIDLQSHLVSIRLGTPDNFPYHHIYREFCVNINSLKDIKNFKDTPHELTKFGFYTAFDDF